MEREVRVLGMISVLLKISDVFGIRDSSLGMEELVAKQHFGDMRSDWIWDIIKLLHVMRNIIFFQAIVRMENIKGSLKITVILVDGIYYCLTVFYIIDVFF